MSPSRFEGAPGARHYFVQLQLELGSLLLVLVAMLHHVYDHPVVVPCVVHFVFGQTVLGHTVVTYRLEIYLIF